MHSIVSSMYTSIRASVHCSIHGSVCLSIVPLVNQYTVSSVCTLPYDQSIVPCLFFIIPFVYPSIIPCWGLHPSPSIFIHKSANHRSVYILLSSFSAIDQWFNLSIHSYIFPSIHLSIIPSIQYFMNQSIHSLNQWFSILVLRTHHSAHF